MGSCISGVGGNVIHDFWYLWKGDEGDTIFFLLLTYLRSALKDNTVITCFFFHFLVDNYESYLIYAKINVRNLPPFGPHKFYLIRSWCQNLYKLQQNK